MQPVFPLASSLYVPAAHAAHAIAPVDWAYLPATHEVHAVAPAARLRLLYAPAAQAVQPTVAADRLL